MMTERDDFAEHQPGHALGLVSELASALEPWKSDFCVWHPAGSVGGDATQGEIVEFLVDRRRSAEFEAQLLTLGFKRVLPRFGPPCPGVSDFFGLDRNSGRLIHLL